MYLKEVSFRLPFYSLNSGVILESPDSIGNDRKRTVCISGHREKSIIPYQNNYACYDITVQTVRCLLERYLDLAYLNGYDTFISGLAVGADLWGAEYIADCRRNGKSMSLIGVMPYLHHSDKFPQEYTDLLYKVEKEADKLILMSSNPDIKYCYSPTNKNESRTLYRDRNYFMVDHSSAVIAFLNDGNYYSGTSQTVNYAVRKNLNICRFGIDTVYSLIDRYKNIDKIKNAIQNIV